MNLFKRAYYSVVNNLSKSIVLFLIIFIIGNIMCGALAISESVQSTQKEFRKHYGDKVDVTYTGGIEMHMMNHFPGSLHGRIARECLEKLINQNEQLYSYVDFNYYLKGLQSNELMFEDEEHYVYEQGTIPIHFTGVTNPYTGLIKNYKIELVEGRTFTDKEMTSKSKVILVSDKFKVKKNDEYVNVEVGDQLTFERVIYSNGNDSEILHTEEVSYEVIGIYKRYDNVMVEQGFYTYDNHVARIYTPLNTLLEEERVFAALNENYADDTTNRNNQAMAGEAFLQLKSPDDLKIFANKFEKTIKADVREMLTYTNSDEIYKKISAPIESMTGIANFLIIMSSILCVLILSVAIFILIRNRKHEIGILISLGELKRNVVLQIVLEIFIVSMLALGSSMISGNQLGKMYSNHLVQQQLEQSTQNLAVDEVKLQEELIENYSFALTIEYVGSVLGVGFIVILLSVIIPIGYIVQLKPRKILL